MLARRAADNLKDGFCYASGALRPALLRLDAFAVATPFDEAGASPDELAATLSALEQSLAQSAAQRFASGTREALELVERLLGLDFNNIGIEGWLRECSTFVQTEADVSTFLAFFLAVRMQYAALQGVKSPTDEA